MNHPGRCLLKEHMAQEIERKYLVNLDGWQPGDDSTFIAQGYISKEPNRIVRVRLMGDQAFLTIKGVTVGATRTEFEYEIPAADGRTLLKDFCSGAILEKTRYYESHGGLRWEIDVFQGANHGLVIAEVELGHETQAFKKPLWIGEEVTEDPRYFNSNLIANPYVRWKRALL